jgi:hypothetical protein
MKHITIATALVLLTLGASAQTDLLSFSISGGASLPLGEFASKNHSEGNVGFAQPGPNVQLTGTCPVYQHFGVTVILGYQSNPFDSKAANTDSGFPIANTSYTSYEALAGPSYRQPLDSSGKWALSVRFLLGAQMGNGGGDNTTYGAFAYDGGLGIQFGLSKHCFLEATADFLGATYRKSEEIGANGVSTFYSTALFPHNTVNTDLGIGFRL